MADFRSLEFEVDPGKIVTKPVGQVDRCGSQPDLRAPKQAAVAVHQAVVVTGCGAIVINGVRGANRQMSAIRQNPGGDDVGVHRQQTMTESMVESWTRGIFRQD
jgi:hypothetical protein